MDLGFSGRLRWPACPNELSLRRAGLAAAGRPLLDFSDSNPTHAGLSPSPGLAALSSFADRANLLYKPEPRGLVAGREALAAFYAARPQDFFLCASTSEAYAWLFKLLCDPGESILVPRPGYPLFDHLAGLEAVMPSGYRLEYRHPSGWRVDIESVRDAFAANLAEGRRAKALVLINPNNPTGSYISTSEAESLVELCDEFGAALVVDEVFFQFQIEEARPRSFMGESRVLCFVLGGLSKLLGLPQMKLGWIATSGPGPLVSEAGQRLEIVADAYLSVSTPIMNALPRLLMEERNFAAALGRRLRENLDFLRSALEGGDSPHRVLRCAGGWSAIIESPRILSEEAMALGLLEREGLCTQPGFLFDMEREAFFTASLLLEPGVFREAALRYRRYFEELMRA